MPKTPSDLAVYVAGRIRELREHYDSGRGLSQQALGKAVGTTANTISRWETATYKPSIEDLEQLSRFFGVKLSAFFPAEPESEGDERLGALLRAAKQLEAADLEELQRYAEFRKARRLYSGSRPRRGRKSKPK
jgi:transcriptional regulator with XRE-family HTH domain